jgi:uncharacterized membrane protein
MPFAPPVHALTTLTAGVLAQTPALRDTAAAAGDFNDWKLTLLSPLPTWMLMALALAGLVAIGVSLSGLRGGTGATARAAEALADPTRRPASPRRLRTGLLGLARTLAVLGVLLAEAEPALTRQKVNRLRNRLAVLVDVSDSTEVADGGSGETRAAKGRAFLESQRGALARLEDRFALQFVAFDGRPLDTAFAALIQPPVRGDTPATAQPQSRRDTDIARALTHVSRDPAGRALGGVVLLTDGIDHHALRLDDDGKLPAEAKRLVRALDAPVFPVDLTGGGDALDVAVARVIADEFAFIRNTIEIEAQLEARVYAGGVNVELYREGELVDSQAAAVAPGQRTTVRFRIAPDRVGRFVYTVRVPPVSGESVVSNNEQAFVLRVIRDRTRVLHVCGTPNWDTRFLRGLLKKNPTVDLISFFILRTTDDPTFFTGNDELALIPFPKDELFTTQLRTFDVIIFQDFNYGPYEMERYLANIRDWVNHDGGGFVMLGGDRSFGAGEYAGTPIAEILPVDVSVSDSYSTDPFRPEVTPQGARHPILRLDTAPGGGTAGGGGEISLARLLGALPPLIGTNVVGSLAPNATALLTHPAAPASAMPVLAISEVGRGRVLALTTDSQWRWAIGDTDHEGKPAVYDRFWRNALRWLVHDPDTNPIELRATPEIVAPGQTVRARVRAYNRQYLPAEGARITLAGGPADGSAPTVLGEVSAGVAGDATFDVPLDTVGPYRLTATVREDGSALPLGTEETVVIVQDRNPEATDIAPRRGLLAALADASGGSVVPLTGASLDDLPFKDPKVVRVDRQEHIPLWNKWYALAALAVLAAVEWALRRYHGYI